MTVELLPIPAIHDQGYLEVEAPHSIYWESRGNPAGTPVLFLHGGPGSGCSESHFRCFRPGAFRLVAFDQRGAGRSRPSGEIAGNTTQHLIGDIEKLREALGISRWIVFGGSWGSTLGLAYAEAHPARVSALVLRGVWLCRDSDIDWWLHDMGRIFPEEGARFAGYIPAAERGDLLGAYYARLIDPDPRVHLPAARVWKSYESNCTRLAYDASIRKDLPEDAGTLAKARIEAHYLINNAFLPPGALIAGAGALADIPIFAVHGRYDVVCPIDNAFALAEALPHLQLCVSSSAGHSATEPETAASLVRIMDGLASTTSP